MNFVDYIIIAAYFGGLVIFSISLRNQSDEKDYFLGGRDIGWAPLSLSAMATQLSAISFVSAPAFVGLRDGGGLKWLAYELAVPLSMVLVMFVIAPALYRAGVVSIYEYLENRFGRSTRALVSLSFQVVRSFSTAIMVYAIGLILDVAAGIPFWQSIIFIGVVTLIYSSIGGMKAVVYGDALQMILIFVGLLIVGGFGLAATGGWSGFLENVDQQRLTAIDFSSFGFSGDEFGFFPMLFGGFVLYASYYGCDQTQAQRLISSKDMKNVRRLLLANGSIRFPLVLLYCLVGLIVGVAIMSNPQILALVPPDKPDYMMPVFIINYLPHGLIGLLIVAIMAAAMSSLSSVINSLAAVTLEDLSTFGVNPKTKSAEVIWARLVSVFWGAVILLLSAFAGSIASTVIEAINKVGSALYGPILGVFLLAILSKSVRGISVNIGLLGGLALNIYIWLYQPQVFWIWMNVSGIIATMTLAFLVEVANKRSVHLAWSETIASDSTIDASGKKRLSIILVGIFITIVGISYFTKFFLT